MVSTFSGHLPSIGNGEGWGEGELGGLVYVCIVSHNKISLIYLAH